MKKRILTCPHCKKEFEVDEASYADLLSQVRNSEFNKELLKKDEENQKLINETIKRIRLEEENKFTTSENEYQKKIAELTNKLNSINKDNEYKLEKALADSKSTIDALNNKLDNEKTRIELAIANETNKYKEIISNREKEINDLKNKVNNVNKDFEIEKQKINIAHEAEIEKMRVDLDKWKSYRMGDSTKDLGESLEQYCYDKFEEIHASTYPYAKFYKDNDESKGSKGDFIFKDFANDGIELTSIMFEMKNEKDTTATKHKNEEFFAKLDKDRTAKGCEYAVLVTTLEKESSLYNKGIVDMSHKYPKMYVVRPQHFLTIISLIRNMSLKSYEYKKQVTLYQNEHIDITNFEEQVKNVASKIANDYQFAINNYNQVDDMCDKMIKKINDFRDSFKVAYKHLGYAQNKLEDLSIRRLTKNNPTMKAKFDELANKDKKKDK